MREFGHIEKTLMLYIEKRKKKKKKDNLCFKSMC